MPGIERLNLFRSIRNVQTPQIGSFEVIQDSSFVGHKIKLKWEYNDDNIIGFRVWRATSKKVLLKRNYLISQTALEKITGLKSFYVRNTALFSKQFFSENSKVEFFQSNSSRFLKADEEDEIDFHRFTDIAFVKKNRQVVGGPRSNRYEFVDRRIKFGETYLYVISALTTGMFDSKKSRPTTVRVEDLLHPDAPKKIKLFVGPSSINVNIDVDLEAKDVDGFRIFRREDAEDNFIRVADINADEKNIVNWLDFDTIPGRAYNYKVYSKDFYGNLSFTAEEHRIRYDTGFSHKQDVPPPEVNLRIDTGKVILTGIKNSDDIIGYRFERKDVWRFAEKFEIKDYIGVSWPNVNLFDATGSAELVDQTAISGNVYQYRATSIKKNGMEATFLVTPQIRIRDGYILHAENNITNVEAGTELTGTATFDDLEPSEDAQGATGSALQADLLEFNACVEDTKQKPIFTKLSWNIEGDWSYLEVDIVKGFTFEGAETVRPQSGTIQIDNVHEDNSIYFTDLELSNSYEMRVRVYDGDGTLLDESDENQVTRISI